MGATLAHAECAPSGTTLECSGSTVVREMELKAGFNTFNLPKDATLDGWITRFVKDGPVTINISGAYSGRIDPGTGSSVYFDGVSTGMSFRPSGGGNTFTLAPGAVASGGDATNNLVILFAPGSSNPAPSHTLYTSLVGTTLNIYGSVESTATAIITHESYRSGETTDSVINLYPGSTITGDTGAIKILGESRTHINANGTTLTSNSDTDSAILIQGGGPFAKSRDGVYDFNDTVFNSKVSAIHLESSVAHSVNDNQFTFRGATVNNDSAYGVIIGNGTGNTFTFTGTSNISGSRIGINTNGTSDDVTTATGAITADDINTFIIRDHARVGGGSGVAFNGGAGQDVIVLEDQGHLDGDVRTGAGNDSFTMRGGTLTGTLDMGTGNDTARFIKQNDASLKPTSLIDGGLGTDTLILESTMLTSVKKLVNWENIYLAKGSQLTLDDDLVLSDSSGSPAGRLSIDASSRLYAGNNVNPVIGSFDGLSPVTVTNAGIIDLTSGSSPAFNSLRIIGNYVGQGGYLIIGTQLGGDNAPSGRLIIDGGVASGSTILAITSVPGSTPVLTTGNGILVVQAVNGAVTTGDSPGRPDQSHTFRLAGRVAAGAYEYSLHAGGNILAGGNPNDQNWYLRNTLIPQEIQVQETPDIRAEVATDMAIMPLATEYGYTMLGTLHDRVGATPVPFSDLTYEEHVVHCNDAKTNYRCVVRVPISDWNDIRWLRYGWARVIGSRGIHSQNDFFRAGPDYDYTFAGMQAGLDAWVQERADGTIDKAGFYAGYGQVTSNVKDEAGSRAGSVLMNAFTAASYWSHFSTTGWYTDTVLQGTWYATDATSIYRAGIRPDGFGILGSIEGGRSYKLGTNWMVEPQAQVIYQNVSFDKDHDAYGLISFSGGDSIRARIGARFTRIWIGEQGDRTHRPVTLWVRANLWHAFLGRSQVNVAGLNGLGTTTLSSPLDGTWGEVGAGVTAKMADDISLFATGAYSRSLDDRGREGWDGRVGMRVKW